MATLRVNKEFIRRAVFASQQFVLSMGKEDLGVLAAITAIAAETFWENHNGNDEIDRENFNRLDSLAKELNQAFNLKEA